MYYTNRFDVILKILQKKGNTSVHYLSKQLFVSEPTIRRDLTELEKQGKIKRTFGGAVYCEVLNIELPLSLRENTDISAKKEIAEKASKHLKSGQVLFLDASSTVSYLIPYILKLDNMTIVTNSPKLSLELAKNNINSLSTGGIMLNNSIAYVGSYAEKFILDFNADIIFFSCRGVSDDGFLTDSSIEESSIRRVMLSKSNKKIFLCASNKIGKKYMNNICHLNDIDEMITEKGNEGIL